MGDTPYLTRPSENPQYGFLAAPKPRFQTACFPSYPSRNRCRIRGLCRITDSVPLTRSPPKPHAWLAPYFI
ncbi:hypothetical protein HMPREF9123_1477 [Neisseria bacilliformis ATCC BAA-1200]|uniref:Uncharacterized protein n=1 Tax=Neisseria bacilliformis ATCC BAA-1200 TaxID=888742 RepID=F2BCQ2_9NEIS|nr:hypothetical protein HMPREF9123_1477 [Neisseria bacilliformis ATCC BAA-1200]